MYWYHCKNYKVRALTNGSETLATDTTSGFVVKVTNLQVHQLLLVKITAHGEQSLNFYGEHI